MKKLVALIVVVSICLASFPCVFAETPYEITASGWCEGGQGVGFYDAGGEAPETKLHGDKTAVILREGEWVKYSLPEMEQGIYKLSINAACSSDATVNIDVGNTRMIGFASINATGGADEYSEIELGNVFIYDGAEEITVSNDKYRVGYTNTAFSYESLSLERVSDDIKVRIYADKTIPGGQGVGSYSTRYAQGTSDRTPEKAADINYYTGIIQRSGDWAKYDISYLPEGTYSVSFESAHPSNITINMATVLEDDIEYAKTIVIPKTANSGYTTFAQSGIIDNIFVRGESKTLLIKGQTSAYNLRYIELEFVDSENLTLVDEYKFSAQNVYSKELGVGFFDNGEHASSVGKWETNTSNGITSTVFRNGEWGKYDISLLKPGRYCAYFYGGAKEDTAIELTVDNNKGVEFTFEKTGAYTTYLERRSVFFDVPENSRHLTIKVGKIAFIIDVTLKIINELEYSDINGNLKKAEGEIPRGTDVLNLKFSNDIASCEFCELTSESGDVIALTQEIKEGKINLLLKEALKADCEYNIVMKGIEDIYGQSIDEETVSFITTEETDTSGSGTFTVTEGKYSYTENTFTAKGKALSSAGLPVKNRKIFLSVIDTNSVQTKRAEFLTDENGEFECIYKMPSDSVSGKYELVLSADTIEKTETYSVLYFDDEGKKTLVNEFEGKTEEEIKSAIELYGESLNIDSSRVETDIDDISTVYKKLSEITSYDGFEELLNTVNCVIYTEYVNSADSNEKIKEIYKEKLFRQYLGFDNNYLGLISEEDEDKLIQHIADGIPFDDGTVLFNHVNEGVNDILTEKYSLAPQFKAMEDISVTEGQIGIINIAFENEEKNISEIVLKLKASGDMEFFNGENVSIQMAENIKNTEMEFKDNILTISVKLETPADISDICTVDITVPDSEAGMYTVALDANVKYVFDDTEGYAVEADAVKTNEIILTASEKNNSKKPQGSSGGNSSGGISSNTDFASKPIDTENVENTPLNKGFGDIAEYKWAEKAINYLAQKGVISGKSEGVFAPADKITRAEFCKIVVLAFEIPFSNAEAGFTDVSADAWEYDYVMAAYSAGLINGISETEFGSSNEIRREDMACIINRYIGVKSNELSLSFADSDDISDYAKEAVANLCSMKIVSGMDDNMFCPKLSVTRVQAAQLVYNAVTEG